jgi:KUP system potassium uptake protein
MNPDQNVKANIDRLSLAGFVLSLGIVYGDIGTSCLFTLQSIVNTLSTGHQLVQKEVVLGIISCIIWTLTFQTTIKYVFITLSADNHGEGGIFALFSLVRRKYKWLIIPAMIGSCALLADGIITPPISITSAIEGVRDHLADTLKPGPFLKGNLLQFCMHLPVIPIVMSILVLLFLVQHFGTQKVGKAFGPIMLVWFCSLGFWGLAYILKFPEILKSFNPFYAYRLLISNPLFLAILGGVFLCTTGAEALYSDLGHCGRKNIQASWILVKSSLILNYLGQGAWLISPGNLNTSFQNRNFNPFFDMMPEWSQTFGVILSTIAAIIASQALISGSFTLINEAMRLGLWPKIRVKYDSNSKGQIYVPSINYLLMVGCCMVVLLFQKAANMDAAYGLSITVAMLMTTFLVTLYLRIKKLPLYLIGLFASVYIIIEGFFLVGNLTKFTHGGWLSLLIGLILFSVMWAWYNVASLKQGFLKFDSIESKYPIFREIIQDNTISKFATHLIFITDAPLDSEVEVNTLYSILYKQPKRADVYWFIHFEITDAPYGKQYKVLTGIPNHLFRIDFKLGFREDQYLPALFRTVLTQMTLSGEVDSKSRYPSLKKFDIDGDRRYLIIDDFFNNLEKLPFFEGLMINYYILLNKIAMTRARSFGLEDSFVTVETVPIVLNLNTISDLKRIPQV